MSPFDEEWCVPDRFCDNCDDQETAAKVYCLACCHYFCQQCDMVRAVATVWLAL